MKDDSVKDCRENTMKKSDHEKAFQKVSNPSSIKASIEMIFKEMI